MRDSNAIIDGLLMFFEPIRYVALYRQGTLVQKQREPIDRSSAAETDRYEELLVNPALLTLARQRGNIDCGGLHHIIVAYGNFNQLIKEIPSGHISICLAKSADAEKEAARIFEYLGTG